MKRRTCPRCECSGEVIAERWVSYHATDELATNLNREYCPHYQHTAVTPAAYEVNLNMDDVFKDRFSCAYCPYRVVETTGGFYCPFELLDPKERNMYYLAPEDVAERTVSVRKVVVSYWTCKHCASRIEISRRTTEIPATSRQD